MSTSAGTSSSVTAFGVGAVFAIKLGAPPSEGASRDAGLSPTLALPGAARFPSRSGSDLNAAVELLHLVHVQGLGRGAVDHGSRG